MPSKELEFDCNYVSVDSSTKEYFHIEITTNYPNEVLDNFSNDEIIEHHRNLDELYQALKEHYGDYN
jgi:hypothetical protein